MRALGLSVMVACGAPRAPAPVKPVETPPVNPVEVKAEDGELPAPGCTARERTTRGEELAAIATSIANRGDSKVVLEQLHAVLARPCLAWTKNVFELPAATTIEAIANAWSFGLAGAFDDAMTIPIRRGRRHVVIPPMIVPSPTDDQVRALAPFACPPKDPACARASAYMLRAEEAFDAKASAQERQKWPKITSGSLDVELEPELCTTWLRDEGERPKTLEGWTACVAARSLINRRYAAGLSLRAPDRGWLVLRGRRGHYDFADEVRAYDLTTGAAYVVTEPGQLIPNGPAPKRDAFTGTVVAEHVRELAFVLLTRAAVVEVRTAKQLAVLPAAIPLRVSPQTTKTYWGRGRVVSSDETTIEYVFLDGATQFMGTFVWPESDDWVNQHATALVRVMEAGMARTCAPARLPPTAELFPPGGRMLPGIDVKLDALRRQVCRGVK